ncbi:MAG: hypothetical protein HC875_36920 [Anaerolineales bacterium]|nr:hypothetical protein [Anaerolineales bacterium]
MIKNPYDIRILGLYGQRLDSCNIKFRFAAKSYLEVISVLNELEHGEFIYFDDESRLKVSFYIESLMIFLRACLDMAVSAYYIYFSGKTDLDSFNDFLKKLANFSVWLPNESKEYWDILNIQYSSDEFAWIHALAGSDKGMSLRDIAVHKSLIEIDTGIDDKDRGYFELKLSKGNYGHAQTWINSIYQNVEALLDMLKRDIVNAEKLIEAAA